MALVKCPNGHLYSVRRYGNICPYCNMETKISNGDSSNALMGKCLSEAESSALQEALLKIEINPVCGWLICIEGARQGKDYRIHAGKNFIGRSDTMDIQIVGDNLIAKKNHAIIVYDPKKRNFVLLPGDSSGLTYLNEEPVYIPTTLSPYDVIEMGESRFVFVPFCGEHFEWNGES